MPCWTVAKSEVKLQGLNPEFLRAALTALGFSINTAEYSQRRGYSFSADRFSDGVSVVIALDGTVSVNASERATDLTKLGNEVKRAYSVQVVQAASKRFGWSLKQTSENKYAVQRRF